MNIKICNLALSFLLTIFLTACAANERPVDGQQLDDEVEEGEKIVESRYPWRIGVECELPIYTYSGLHPSAAKVIVDLELEHRITQALNRSIRGSNYHGKDTRKDGRDVTSSFDLSVRCLDDGSIRKLLDALATSNVVAWLRRDGVDGWKGADHIHAIWVGDELKPQLDQQVTDWLENRNGLVSNLPYEYWAPSELQKINIRELR